MEKNYIIDTNVLIQSPYLPQGCCCCHEERPWSRGEIIAFRQLSFRTAKGLMGNDICQHITEDNKIRRKGGQFFFRQTFTELAGDGGEIKKVGTVNVKKALPC